MSPSSSRPRIRLVRAGNVSPLTHTGTNSYILGSGRVAVIDPGPDDPAHLAALLAALDAKEEISHIVVTHPHRDHSASAARLARATGAPVLAMGQAEDGRSLRMQDLVRAGQRSAGGDGLDLDFRPDRRIHDRETISGDDWQVDVHHTPGHLGTHACLSIGSTLFSGDHVMGWSTSVIVPPDGDMGDYLDSLHRLSQANWSEFLPGHGDAIKDPGARLAELIAHRTGRMAQILSALQDGPATISQLTARMYPGLAPELIPAAGHNILAHLIDLAAKNRTATTDFTNPGAMHRLI
jgi:glyoxylase-like metal-dependent hydrolase (beta-lactamase superfamily II)